MKKITKVVHNLIRIIHAENAIARNSKTFSILRKLLPTNKEYTKKQIKIVNRDNAKFELRISDYMQWHIYAYLPEPLWKYARNKIKPNSVIVDIGAMLEHLL